MLALLQSGRLVYKNASPPLNKLYKRVSTCRSLKSSSTLKAANRFLRLYCTSGKGNDDLENNVENESKVDEEEEEPFDIVAGLMSVNPLDDPEVTDKRMADLQSLLDIFNESGKSKKDHIYTKPIDLESEQEAVKLETELILRHMAVVMKLFSNIGSVHIPATVSIESALEGGKSFIQSFVTVKPGPITNELSVVDNKIVLVQDTHNALLTNPYLFQEKPVSLAPVGLTEHEYVWLLSREKWRSLVNKKQNFTRTLNQLETRQSQKVEKLFSDTLKILMENQDPTFLNELDVQKKSDPTLLESKERVKSKLTDIYRQEPDHWADIVLKYINTPDTISEKAFQPSFWTLDNPFIYKGVMNHFQQEVSKVIEYSEALTNEKLETTAKILSDADIIKDESTEQNPEEKPVKELFSTKSCHFCGKHRHVFPLEPMNVPLLQKFMNTSGKILSREYTGLCKKHQKRLSRVIKYARHMNLFTHKKSEYSINDPFKPAVAFGGPILGEDGAIMNNINLNKSREMLKKLTLAKSDDSKSNVYEYDPIGGEPPFIEEEYGEDGEDFDDDEFSYDTGVSQAEKKEPEIVKPKTDPVLSEILKLKKLSKKVKRNIDMEKYHQEVNDLIEKVDHVPDLGEEIIPPNKYTLYQQEEGRDMNIINPDVSEFMEALEKERDNKK